jgi:cell division protein FtsB
MSIIREMRKRSAALIVPVLGACLVLYVSYYTIDGHRGLKAMTRVQADVSVAETRLDVLQTQRAVLESQVGKLRPESIDPDLLDERARAVLNFSKPTDLVLRQSVK